MELKANCQAWLDAHDKTDAHLNETSNCPPLNISEPQLASIDFSYSVSKHGKKTVQLSTSNMTVSNKTYGFDNPPLYIVQDQFPDILYWREAKTKTVTDATGLRDNTSCQAEKNYQWGFSVQILLTLGVLTLLFAAAVMILHLDAYWHSRLNRYTPQFSIYSDIIDIAEEIRSQFKVEAGELSPMELKRIIKQGLGAIAIDDTCEYPMSRRHKWQDVREKWHRGNTPTLREEIALTKMGDVHRIDEVEGHRLLPSAALQKRLGGRVSHES